MNRTFIGMGHNPYGPDLPEGFGMRLAQEPMALENYGNLTDEQKTSVIRYIRSGSTGEQAEILMAEAIKNLSGNNLSAMMRP